IARQLADGPREVDDLAAAAGCDAAALRRVLRHLVSHGVFDEPTPGTYDLNDAARALLDPGMRAFLDLDGIGGRIAHAWGTLLSVVRTGRPAYHEVFDRPFW
ncbi:MAG TPA: hydroxyneurosporene methyltransferase, partial [Actinopolymorphaceae bacterium]|nr:hydroxyneurosporene methyltransferase [Actinopolymorphaceae bacterium]